MTTHSRLVLLVVLSGLLGLCGTGLASGAWPKPIHQESVLYPDAAYRNNREGVVIVRVLQDLNGHVERAEVEKSDSLFDAPALAAARKWTFERALDDSGQAVKLWQRIPFRFRLADPATDPRVLSDSLWRAPWKSTPAVMRQQREALMRTMRNAEEIWLFRLDANSESEVRARSRFDQRTILDDALVTDKATRDRIIKLLSDARTHARPPRLRGEHTPRLGIRFVAKEEVLDVAISFGDAAMFLKDGQHLWAASAMPHWSEWGRLAHATFPDDPNFGHYTTDNPMAP